MGVNLTGRQAKAIGYATAARFQAEAAKQQLDQLTRAFEFDDELALSLLDEAVVYLEHAHELACHARAAVADCQHIVWSPEQTADCFLLCAHCGLYISNEDDGEP